MIQSMLGASSPECGVVINSTHWSKLWVGHTSLSNLIQDALKLHSIWTTTFLVYIPTSAEVSSAGAPTSVTTATDTYGFQNTLMFHVLSWFVVPPKNLNGGTFTNVIGLSESILYFMNIINVGWSFPFPTSSGCCTKGTSTYAFPHHFLSHIMCPCCIVTECHTPTSYFSGQFHNIHLHCKNLARPLCTTWGKFYSDSNLFQSISIL